MNLAKIKPAVKKTFQVSPFETKVEEADHMAIAANRYVIGGKEGRFEIRFGNYDPKAVNAVDKFKVLLRHEVVLSKEELADWGTDDSILFEKIAKKLGTSVVNIVEDDIHQTN